MMRDDKLIELLEMYAKQGIARGYGNEPAEPEKLSANYYSEGITLRDDNNSGHSLAMRHAAWMATQAIGCIKEAQAQDDRPGGTRRNSQREKAHRWLGFIQATLWLCGAYTLNELKEHSRKCSDEPEKEETKR